MIPTLPNKGRELTASSWRDDDEIAILRLRKNLPPIEEYFQWIEFRNSMLKSIGFEKYENEKYFNK